MEEVRTLFLLFPPTLPVNSHAAGEHAESGCKSSPPASPCLNEHHWGLQGTNPKFPGSGDHSTAGTGTGQGANTAVVAPQRHPVPMQRVQPHCTQLHIHLNGPPKVYQKLPAAGVKV